MKPRVDVLGGAEAGKLAHGPELAAVHGAMNTAGVGVLTRIAEVAVVIEFVEVILGIELLYRDARKRGEVCGRGRRAGPFAHLAPCFGARPGAGRRRLHSRTAAVGTRRT